MNPKPRFHLALGILFSFLISSKLARKGEKRRSIRITDTNGDDSDVKPQGKIIFRDFRTLETFYESDCPDNPNDNPKLILYTGHTRNYFALTCLAAYPITMDFKGYRTFVPKIYRTVGKSSPKKMDQACYLLHAVSGSTYTGYPIGNVTCRSLSEDTLRESSMYTYRPDKSRIFGNYLKGSFNLPANYIVKVNLKKLSLLHIPCQATYKSISKVSLRKEHKDYESMVKLEEHPDMFQVKYDKTRGFTVKFLQSDLSNKVISIENSTNFTRIDKLGEYECVDESIFNILNVKVNHSDVLAFPTNPKVTFSEGYLSVECYAGEPVSIKVLNSSVQLARLAPSTNSAWSNFLDDPEVMKDHGYLFSAKQRFQTKDATAHGTIGCVAQKSGVPLTTWTFDNAYQCECTWNSSNHAEIHYSYYSAFQAIKQSVSSKDRSGYGDGGAREIHNFINDWELMHFQQHSGSLSCSNSKNAGFLYGIFSCWNEVECSLKDKFCIKNDCSDITAHHGTMFNYGGDGQSRLLQAHPGILKCSPEEEGYDSSIRIYVDSIENNMVFKKLKPENDLMIKGGENHFYTGDQMLFACGAQDPTLSLPLIWAFEFKNGTVQYINYTRVHGASHITLIRYRNKDYMTEPKYGGFTAYRYTLLTIPDTSVKKLWCHAPRWTASGAEWRNVSVDMQVEEGKIAEDPPRCISGIAPSIIMLRNSSVSRIRVRKPHIVDGKDVRVYDPIEFVTLHCIANYPVAWHKDGEDIPETDHSRSNCRDEKGKVQSKKLYMSTLSFRIQSVNATGNYSCYSIWRKHHHSRVSSMYLYAMSPENRTIFVNEGHHHVINHNVSSATSSWEILPCRVNHPKFIPYLFIENVNSESVTRVPLHNTYLKFFPKQGFHIDTKWKYVKNSTLFYCSDHKDGSFIGYMVTLNIISDHKTPTTTIKPTDSTTEATPSNSSSIPPNITHASTSKSVSNTTEIGNSEKIETKHSTTWIVLTVLMTIACVICLAVIYIMYKKMDSQKQYQGKFSPSHELNWTDRSPGHDNNLIDSYPVNTSHTPQHGGNVVTSGYNNVGGETNNEGNNDNSYSSQETASIIPHESNFLSSFSENAENFSYKKL